MAVLYCLIFLFGLAIGSFVNVLIFRIPLKKSIIFPASSCTSCDNRLLPLELIPILSYVLQRG